MPRAQSVANFKFQWRPLIAALIAVLFLQNPLLAQQQTVRVTFEALLVKDGKPLENGVEWRIFDTHADLTGEFPMLANANGGSKVFDISPGIYMIHVAYGHAGAIRKIEINSKSGKEIFILNAGGLALSAVTGENVPIPESLLRFDVYEQESDKRGKQKLIANEIKPDEIVPFPEGTYHVVSHFGNLNAQIRADLRVKAGKVTTAQVTHRAAQIQLRLVRSAGGDALANTAWSVLNESGDLITESTSAFPNIVLSEGNYSAIAKNDETIYSQDFVVEAGSNQDVEVLTDK